MRKALLAVALIGASFSLPAWADSIDVHVNTGDVSFGVDIGRPPPAPVVEVIPVARPGYVWAPGYWAWEGHRHIWVNGAWEREHPGYSYAPSHWVQRGDRWHFEPGRWEAGRSVERHKEAQRHEAHRTERDRYEQRRDHEYARDRG